MCGIIGVIGKRDVDSEILLSQICHRGPDSRGAFEKDNLILGHTRLSIQDLSENGNQPMFSFDKRYVIIFNGEIYNHHEIREKLINEYTFRSTGDTETVLYAFIKYGPACLNMFNGIFSLAIYDSIANELFIARDQIGVKPLYIYKDDNYLMFSSEIKAFLPYKINKELKREAFVNYLTFLWSPGSITPFKYVTKLLPGHFIQFELSDFKNVIPIRYYQWTNPDRNTKMAEEELVDLLEEKLIAAVKRQMLSDVPVGFFLSGGLDSSLLVAIAKKLSPNTKLPCFTIDIHNWSDRVEDFGDDLYYAKKVAEVLDVDLHVVKASVDIVKDFDRMIWHLDEPQADAAPLNVLNIASLAYSKGIKVLIGGTAGDDLFSGYRRHQAIRYETFFRLVPGVIRKGIKKIIQQIPSNRPTFRRLKKLTQDIDKSVDERLAGYFTWLQPELVNSLFSNEWKKSISKYNPLEYFYLLAREIFGEKDLLKKMLYWETKTFLVDHNLNYTDKMAMAVGVEVRVPFLDMELVEFSKKIPSELKMKGKETKYILKKVAERYLPNEVIYRSKTGFGAPIREWIVNNMDEVIRERLSPEMIKKRGIFDPDKVWQLISDNKEGKIDASYSIWAILAIESWMRQFVDVNTKN